MGGRYNSHSPKQVRPKTKMVGGLGAGGTTYRKTDMKTRSRARTRDRLSQTRPNRIQLSSWINRRCKQNKRHIASGMFPDRSNSLRRRRKQRALAAVNGTSNPPRRTRRRRFLRGSLRKLKSRRRMRKCRKHRMERRRRNLIKAAGY